TRRSSDLAGPRVRPGCRYWARSLAYLNSPDREVSLDAIDRVVAVVKDGSGEHRVRARCECGGDMRSRPDTARGDDRNAHRVRDCVQQLDIVDRKSTRLNSSHVAISYAVFCL